MAILREFHIIIIDIMILMAVGTIPKPTKLQSETAVGSGKTIIAISTLSFCLQFLFS